MDPDEAFTKMCELNLSIQERREHAINLRQWIANGGHYPTNASTYSSVRRMITQLLEYSN